MALNIPERTLNAVNKELRRKVLHLTKKIEKIIQENDAISSEVDDFELRFKEFELDQTKLNTNTLKTEEAVVTAQKNLKTLEREISKLHSEGGHLENAIAKYQKLLDVIENKTKLCSEKIGGERNAIEALSVQLHSEQVETQNREKFISSIVQEDTKALVTLFDSLNMKKKVLENKLEEETFRFKEVQHLTLELKSQVKSTRIECNLLRENCDIISTQFKSVESRLQHMKNGLKLYENLQESKRKQVTELNRLEELFAQDVSDLLKKLRWITKRRDHSVRSLSEVVSMITHIQSDTDLVKESIANNLKKNMEVTVRCSELRDAHQRLTHVFRAHEVTLKSLQEHLKECSLTENRSSRYHQDLQHILNIEEHDLRTVINDCASLTQEFHNCRRMLENERKIKIVCEKDDEDCKKDLMRQTQIENDLRKTLTCLESAENALSGKLMETRLKTKQQNLFKMMDAVYKDQKNQIFELRESYEDLAKNNKTLLQQVFLANAKLKNLMLEVSTCKESVTTEKENVHTLLIYNKNLESEHFKLTQKIHELSDMRDTIKAAQDVLAQNQSCTKNQKDCLEVKKQNLLKQLNKLEAETEYRLYLLFNEWNYANNERKELKSKHKDIITNVAKRKSEYESILGKLANECKSVDSDRDIFKSPEEIHARYLVEIAAERSRLLDMGDALDDAIVQTENELQMLKNAAAAMSISVSIK